MPSIYPFVHSVKINELLEQLSLVEEQLKIFDEFYGFDKLLKESQDLLNAKENIKGEAIIASINKINDFIKQNFSIKAKIEQINYLMSIIEIYFDQNEIQTINSALAIQKNKFEILKSNEFNNSDDVIESIAAIDSIFGKRIDELLKKIKKTYFEKKFSPCYQIYLEKQLELIQFIEGDKKIQIDFSFQQLYWLIDFLKKFENSHQHFNELQTKFEIIGNKYLNLCIHPNKSKTIDILKNAVELQVNFLKEEFAEFDPHYKLPGSLDDEVNKLDQQINELHQLNQNELIELIENSKQNLIDYGQKLYLLKSKCANNKSQQLKLIIQEIESLLNSETCQPLENISSRNITQSKILGLKKTIKEAETILSEYRGISLLRCVATFFGGGKVRSELLVNKLEEQLTGLQSNINDQPLSL